MVEQILASLTSCHHRANFETFKPFACLRKFLRIFVLCSPLHGRADSGQLNFLSRHRGGFETLEHLLALETFLEFSLSARFHMVEQILASLASYLTIDEALRLWSLCLP